MVHKLLSTEDIPNEAFTQKLSWQSPYLSQAYFHMVINPLSRAFIFQGSLPNIKSLDVSSVCHCLMFSEGSTHLVLKLFTAPQLLTTSALCPVKEAYRLFTPLHACGSFLSCDVSSFITSAGAWNPQEVEEKYSLSTVPKENS